MLMGPKREEEGNTRHVAISIQKTDETKDITVYPPGIHNQILRIIAEETQV